MVRVAVMGSGSWGTAVGKVLADGNNDVVMWARRDSVATEISEGHSNERYLPGIALPESMCATSDAAAALEGADVVVLGVPAQSLAENLRAWKPLLPPDAGYVSLTKGVETA
ncbi:2-dehydropantoate 2-reductase N-terminal domain-containing protein, partial [Dietzia sp.]|uniref:2-dehydropantoate 2-reductase N-terminal domain-containing protein n=1 Tax=Dietzia sp. TaxID=1871616 RepID=UPI002FDA3AEF